MTPVGRVVAEFFLFHLFFLSLSFFFLVFSSLSPFPPFHHLSPGSSVLLALSLHSFFLLLFFLVFFFFLFFLFCLFHSPRDTTRASTSRALCQSRHAFGSQRRPVMLRAPFTEKTTSPDVDGEPWSANYPARNARVAVQPTMETIVVARRALE